MPSCACRGIAYAIIIAGGLLFAYPRCLARAQGLPCIADRNCPAGRFCTRTAFPSLPTSRGTCEGCWQCCLLPHVYGAAACRSRCRCGFGRQCSLDSECGPGEFCGVPVADPASSDDPPTCQPCTACRTDSQAWRGSCAAACPSAALYDNSVPEGAEAHYVFAAFDIRDHPTAREGLVMESDGKVVGVTEDALRLWLGDLPPYTLAALISPPLNRTAPGFRTPRVFALGEFAARLAAAAPSRDLLLCPQLSPEAATADTASSGSSGGDGATAITTTFPAAAGCPCNATTSAASFRCPVGHRCSPGAGLSLPTDVVTLGGTALLKARCVACELGTYCPEGTFVEEGYGTSPAALPPAPDRMAVLDCLEGHYCPTPTERHECPAGYFCPARSTAAIVCDYTALLRGTSQQSGLQATAVRGKLLQDTLRRLVDERRPLRGNHCPNGSSAPDQGCRPGYYCPDPSLELTCTPGHYCRAESTQPIACPPLMMCEAGAVAPNVWPAAVAVFCGLSLCVLVAGVVVESLDDSAELQPSNNADLHRKSTAVRTMRRFIAHFHGGHQQLTAANRNVWVVQPHVIDVKNLSWTGPGRPLEVPVLKSVTGRFGPGEISAILGPSGCGKSSLLALLAGRASHWPPSNGKVLINGVRVRSPRELKHVTGFVPQDDILCPELTVEEILEFSAQLRLPRLLSRQASRSNTISRSSSGVASADAHRQPSFAYRSVVEQSPAAGDGACGSTGVDSVRQGSVGAHVSGDSHCTTSSALSSAEERKQLVEEVLGMLDLKMLRKQRVGGISDRSLSGGQRKRVNIGVELVARPPVLLLDEPTSGLDAACSSDVLSSLLDLAEERQVNVIIVVHQPRRALYELFGTVMLLDRNGRSVYHGDARKAMGYFESLGFPFPQNENVPDRLLDIIMGKCYSKTHRSDNLPMRASIDQPARLDELRCGGSSINRPWTPATDTTGTTTLLTGLATPAAEGSGGVSSSPQDVATARAARTRGGNVAPELSEELVYEIEQEYNKIPGEGAAGKLDREGLRKLLQSLEQTGEPVENFVQGILEETARMRQQQEQQQQQQQHWQQSEPEQQRMPTASSAALAGDGHTSHPTVTVAKDELLEVLRKVQGGELTVADLKSRPGSSTANATTSRSGSGSAPSVLVRMGGAILLSVADSLRHLSSPLRIRTKPMVAPAVPADSSRSLQPRSPPVMLGPPLRRHASDERSKGRSAAQAVYLRRRPFSDVVAVAVGSPRSSPLVRCDEPSPRQPARLPCYLPRSLSVGACAFEIAADGARVEAEIQNPAARALPYGVSAAQCHAAPQQLCGAELGCSNPLFICVDAAAECEVGASASLGIAAGAGRSGIGNTGVRQPPAVQVPSGDSQDHIGGVSSGQQQQAGGPPQHWVAQQQQQQQQPINKHPLILSSAFAMAQPDPTLISDLPPAPEVGLVLRATGTKPGEVAGGDGSGGREVRGLPSIAGASGAGAEAGASGSPRELRGGGAQQAVRQHPRWLSQLNTFARRAMLQSTRGFWPSSMLEVALLLAAAAAVGANQGTQWGPTDVPVNATTAMLCLSVLAVVQHLRSFGSNRLVLIRERGVGLSTTAYFIARCLADLPWIAVAPTFFSLPYYIITVPRASYMTYYVVSVGIWWWASGLSYLITVAPLIPPAAAPTAAVLLTLIAGALLNGVTSPTLAEARGTLAEALLNVSYSRWAVEALTISELDEYLDSHGNIIAAMYHSKGLCLVDTIREGGDSWAEPWPAALLLVVSSNSSSSSSGGGPSITRGYCHNSWLTALIVLFSLGLGLRVLACLTLTYDTRILAYSFAAWDWLRRQRRSGGTYFRNCSRRWLEAKRGKTDGGKVGDGQIAATNAAAHTASRSDSGDDDGGGGEIEKVHPLPPSPPKAGMRLRSPARNSAQQLRRRDSRSVELTEEALVESNQSPRVIITRIPEEEDAIDPLLPRRPDRGAEP